MARLLNTIPRQIELNPINLSFKGECQYLETIFLEVYNEEALKYIRVPFIIGLIMFAAFGFLDAKLVPEQKAQLWFIRYYFICPSILAGFLFSFVTGFKKYLQAYLAGLMVISGAGISIMVAIANPPANYSYYAGVILVSMMGYGCIKARFVWAFLAGWTNVLFYEIVAIFVIQTPGEILLNNNFFFISANIIGMLICYSIELYTRKDFFMAQRVQCEQNKTLDLNMELEQRVLERTADIKRTNEQLKKEIQAHEYEKQEKKQAEIELLESEKRFKELAKMLPETIFEVDLTGKLTFVNLKGFHLFGYTEEDFVKGINLFDFIHENDKKKASDNITKIFNGEDVGITEYYVQNKDGHFFPALFHSSTIYKLDKPIGLRGFLIDITEKKRTQEMLIQNEKMLSVGGLAAGMAHEINNPLAGMIQNAQVLINRLSKDFPANEKAAKESGIDMKAIKSYMEKRGVFKQLEHINLAGFHAAKIVDNMLNFAKKNDSIKSFHDLSLIFDKTLDLLKNDYNLKKKCDFKNIKIIREIDPSLPKVLCEETKIQQVLMNLIKNSMDETIGKLNDSKNLVLIFRLKREKDMVCMEIEDNGPGIDQKTQKRIFEPFFSTKDTDKGTGLGLSISYFIIVDDHGGKMEVESVLGMGTKFIVKFPYS